MEVRRLVMTLAIMCCCIFIRWSPPFDATKTSTRSSKEYSNAIRKLRSILPSNLERNIHNNVRRFRTTEGGNMIPWEGNRNRNRKRFGENRNSKKSWENSRSLEDELMNYKKDILDLMLGKVKDSMLGKVKELKMNKKAGNENQYSKEIYETPLSNRDRRVKRNHNDYSNKQKTVRKSKRRRRTNGERDKDREEGELDKKENIQPHEKAIYKRKRRKRGEEQTQNIQSEKKIKLKEHRGGNTHKVDVKKRNKREISLKTEQRPSHKRETHENRPNKQKDKKWRKRKKWKNEENKKITYESNNRNTKKKKKKRRNSSETNEQNTEMEEDNIPDGSISKAFKIVKNNHLAILTDNSCGKTFDITTGETIVLVSNNDGKAKKCSLRIKGPQEKRLSLKCPIFELSEKGCKKEKLFIKDVGGSFKKAFCKDKNPETNMPPISSNVLQIRHTRKKQKSSQCTRGYLCTVAVTDATSRTTVVNSNNECGPIFLNEDESAVIYSNGQGKKVDCKLNITGPKGRTLFLQCPSMNLDSRGCGKEKLRVKDKAGGFNGKFCKQDNPSSRIGESISNNLVIVHNRRKTPSPDCSGGFMCVVSVVKTSTTTTNALSTTTTKIKTKKPTTTTTSAAPQVLPTKLEPQDYRGPGVNVTEGPRLFCKGCGISIANVTPLTDGVRVIGGQDANVGEYPWMALLQFRNDIVPGKSCGGSLIKRNWVLTAAHCITDITFTTIAIYLGYLDRTEDDEDRTSGYMADDIILHPNFNPTTGEHDLALLKLDRPVVFSQWVQPICLSQPEDVIFGDPAIVTGWGLTEYEGTNSNILQETVVYLTSLSRCRELYTSVFTITENMLCASADGRDACQGDSGGPLIVQLEDKRWVQVGIISFGVQCALKNSPGVYTYVGKYLDWINKNTGSEDC